MNCLLRVACICSELHPLVSLWRGTPQHSIAFHHERDNRCMPRSSNILDKNIKISDFPPNEVHILASVERNLKTDIREAGEDDTLSTWTTFTQAP